MTSPTAPTINSAGISAPQFADILSYLQAQYQSIYGADVYLGNDSQDGQFLGIIAAAINDSNAATIAMYNSLSPATASGNGLSNNVQINGITRLVSTNSTVDLLLVGIAGTTISNGVVKDTNSIGWNLPTSVTIPSSGSITVTATCATSGSVNAAPATVTSIQTPVYGWQSATNANAASPGNPVETDAALRVRQAASVALPSVSIISGILGAVESLTGVSEAVAYENSTNTTNANGLPAHSISLVVNGGDATQIATAIMNKKTPGCATYGTTTQTVIDSGGVSNVINFYRPTVSNVKIAVTLHALTNYTTVIQAEIQAAIAAYINNLSIGQSVMLTRLYLPAQLNGAADSLTFEIVSIQGALVGGTNSTTDIAIAFNGVAACLASNVTVTAV